MSRLYVDWQKSLALTGTVIKWLAVAMLVGYQFLLDRGGGLGIVLHSSHGGMHGAVAWTAMLVLGTVLADWYHLEEKGRRVFPWASLALLLIGLALMWWFAISKSRVSSTFVLVSTGIGGLLFWAFHLYAARHEGRLKLLVAWGANPLFLYIVHLLVLAVYDIPPVPWWFHEAPMWLVALQIAFLLGSMSWLAAVMQRREVILSL